MYIYISIYNYILLSLFKASTILLEKLYLMTTSWLQSWIRLHLRVICSLRELLLNVNPDSGAARGWARPSSPEKKRKKKR